MKRVKTTFASLAIVSLLFAMMAQISAAQTAATTQEPFYIGGVSSPQENTDLLRWFSDTRKVLASSAFHKNLAAIAGGYSAISYGTVLNTKPPADLLTIMKVDGTNYRYVPTPVALIGDQYTGNVMAGQNGEQVNGIYVTSMSIGRQHLVRYRSTNVVEKSCAINTLAHELSHLISSHPTWANAVFEDTYPGGPAIGGKTPIASYLIGSVAQCTFLQMEGRIKESEVKACVATFGESEFMSLRCNQFKNGDPIKQPGSSPRR